MRLCGALRVTSGFPLEHYRYTFQVDGDGIPWYTVRVRISCFFHYPESPPLPRSHVTTSTRKTDYSSDWKRKERGEESGSP